MKIFYETLTVGWSILIGAGESVKFAPLYDLEHDAESRHGFSGDIMLYLISRDRVHAFRSIRSEGIVISCAARSGRGYRAAAQAINGRTEAANIHSFDWGALARTAGLGPRRTLRRVAEMCALADGKASEARERVASLPAGDHSLTRSIVHAIQKRKRIARQLEVHR